MKLSIGFVNTVRRIRSIFARNPNKGKMALAWKNATYRFSIALMSERFEREKIGNEIKFLRVANRLLKKRNDTLKKMVEGEPADAPPTQCETCGGLGYVGAECEPLTCLDCEGTGYEKPKPRISHGRLALGEWEEWDFDSGSGTLVPLPSQPQEQATQSSGALLGWGKE